MDGNKTVSGHTHKLLTEVQSYARIKSSPSGGTKYLSVPVFNPTVVGYEIVTIRSNDWLPYLSLW